MLKKLIKYEFMATGRIFLPMYGALIMISIINRVLILAGPTVPLVISSLISYVLILCIFVLTLALTIQRFKKNLLSNEGYLMMTLPVTTDSLILSKLIVSGVWAAASFFTVTLSLSILINENIFMNIFRFLGWIGEMLSINTIQGIVYIAEIIFIAAFFAFSVAMLIYTCISLGMLVNRHRGLFAFGAFIVITTAMQTAITVLFNVTNAIGLLEWINAYISSASNFWATQMVMLIWLIVSLLLAAALYHITSYMLRKRLNLQ